LVNQVVDTRRRRGEESPLHERKHLCVVATRDADGALCAPLCRPRLHEEEVARDAIDKRDGSPRTCLSHQSLALSKGCHFVVQQAITGMVDPSRGGFVPHVERSQWGLSSLDERLE